VSHYKVNPTLLYYTSKKGDVGIVSKILLGETNAIVKKWLHRERLSVMVQKREKLLYPIIMKHVQEATEAC